MVSPDTIRTAIGIIGNGTALVLFLSPVPTFYRIWKKKTVEQYSAVPYLATLLNCMMWVIYGLPVVHPHSMLVITINGTGMAIELTYIALFLAYSVGPARRRVLLILLAEVAFVAAVAALVLNLAHTHERRSMVVGILCVLFGTGMYAAPLSVMKMVIQTKSVEYMPLFLSLASLVNGICWTAYALIKFDLYITHYPDDAEFVNTRIKHFAWLKKIFGPVRGGLYRPNTYADALAEAAYDEYDDDDFLPAPVKSKGKSAASSKAKSNAASSSGKR